MANVGSSIYSVARPMTLVTYQDGTNQKKRSKDHRFDASNAKSTISAQGSARLGIYQEHSSESYQNEKNDFVIQRESMNFRRIPERQAMDVNSIISNSGAELEQAQSARGDINPPGSLGVSVFSTKSY